MKITLNFTKPGYIASPYHVATFKLIEIQKLSGMMRTRSEKKRRESLEAHLRMNGMTLADYDKLVGEAKEPFHKDGGGKIVIPSGNVMSALVNANQEAPSRLRIGNLRAALKPSDLSTVKSKPDGVWERFVVIKSGTMKLSNQRSLRSDSYIEDFKAVGTIEHDPEKVDPKSIVDLLEYCGREIGIGASRKMGWGRFTVEAK